MQITSQPALLTAAVARAATARSEGDPRTDEIDVLLRRRQLIEASKPDLGGSENWTTAGVFGGMVAGSMLGATASFAIEKIPGLPYGRNGYTMAGILLGAGLVFAIGGAVAGGILGERMTRPEGADAQRIKDAHQVKVAKQLDVIDRQLDALGYETSSS